MVIVKVSFQKLTIWLSDIEILEMLNENHRV